MTNNDDFTQAAEDAADRTGQVFIGNNDAAYGYSCGFAAGAEWARAHLTAQEPTAAEVEAAANAIIALVPGETEETARMDDIDDAWDHARAALSAARAARRDQEATR